MAIMYRYSLSAAEHANAGKRVAVPDVTCGTCGGALVGWSGYWRSVRHLAEVLSIWVPRRRCKPCGTTTGLLPEFVLERRLDTVEAIGQAVAARIRGATITTAASEVGVPAETVRDWLRRHRERAPALERGLSAWTTTFTAYHRAPSSAVDRDAATALGVLWHFASRKVPEWGLIRPWRFWSLITGGVALATNTSPLFPRIPVAREMAAARLWQPP